MRVSVEERIKKLGLVLPEAPTPIAAYIPSLLVNGLVFVSGQLAVTQDGSVMKGKVGADLGLEEGYQGAKGAVLRCLAALKAQAGELDKVKQIVQITGYVNCTPEFTQQPQVINGASELLQEIFKERGVHTRVAVGVSGLPLGAAVEIALVAQV